MPSAQRSFPDARAIEAVLHVLDGSRTSDVARRYGVAVSTLSLIVNGFRRADVRDQAVLIYDSYRAIQKEELT